MFYKITDSPDKGSAVDLICHDFRIAFHTVLLSKLFVKMVRVGFSSGVSTLLDNATTMVVLSSRRKRSKTSLIVGRT